MSKASKKVLEKRRYKDNGDWLNVLWDTANVVAPGQVLIRDKEGHAEVDIDWVIKSTETA